MDFMAGDVVDLNESRQRLRPAAPAAEPEEPATPTLDVDGLVDKIMDLTKFMHAPLEDLGVQIAIPRDLRGRVQYRSNGFKRSHDPTAQVWRGDTVLVDGRIVGKILHTLYNDFHIEGSTWSDRWEPSWETNYKAPMIWRADVGWLVDEFNRNAERWPNVLGPPIRRIQPVAHQLEARVFEPFPKVLAEINELCAQVARRSYEQPATITDEEYRELVVYGTAAQNGHASGLQARFEVPIDPEGWTYLETTQIPLLRGTIQQLGGVVRVMFGYDRPGAGFFDNEHEPPVIMIGMPPVTPVGLLGMGREPDEAAAAVEQAIQSMTGSMQSIARHEVIHLTQYVWSAAEASLQDFEKGVRPKDWDRGMPGSQGMPGGPQTTSIEGDYTNESGQKVPHALADVEFWPNVSSYATDFVRGLKRLPQASWPAAYRYFMRGPPLPPGGNGFLRRFPAPRSPLQEGGVWPQQDVKSAPERWRAYVKELDREIRDQLGYAARYLDTPGHLPTAAADLTAADIVDMDEARKRLQPDAEDPTAEPFETTDEEFALDDLPSPSVAAVLSGLARTAGGRTRYSVKGFEHDVLPIGTILFHGTSASFEGLPAGPAWFATEREDAEIYADWTHREPNPYRPITEAPQQVVHAYRVKRPVRLVVLYGSNDLDQLEEALGIWGRHPVDAAEQFAYRGFAGWWNRDFASEVEGDEIMLCDPAAVLEEIPDPGVTRTAAGETERIVPAGTAPRLSDRADVGWLVDQYNKRLEAYGEYRPSNRKPIPRIQPVAMNVPEDFLHGTAHNFEVFRPGGHGLVYLSAVDPHRKTQAEYIAGGPMGGRLLRVRLRRELKWFDPLNDPEASALVDELIAQRGWSEDNYNQRQTIEFLRRGCPHYSHAPDLVALAAPHGYEGFRFYEDSVQGYSYAVTDPSALEIVGTVTPEKPDWNELPEFKHPERRGKPPTWIGTDKPDGWRVGQVDEDDESELDDGEELGEPTLDDLWPVLGDLDAATAKFGIPDDRSILEVPWERIHAWLQAMDYDLADSGYHGRYGEFESPDDDEMWEMVHEAWDEVRATLTYSPAPMRIYREIWAASPQDIRLDRLGVAWSYGSMPRGYGKQPGFTPYVVRADVPDDSVDWIATVLFGIHGNTGTTSKRPEGEIRLREGAPITVRAITQQNGYPIQSYDPPIQATAARWSVPDLPRRPSSTFEDHFDRSVAEQDLALLAGLTAGRAKVRLLPVGRDTDLGAAIRHTRMLLIQREAAGDLLVPFRTRLLELRPALAQAAQKVYDAWDQNEEGIDVELGSGGLCQDIAEALASTLGDHGIDCTTVSAASGEQHVWAVAYDEIEREAVIVDIPPGVYETGGGYTWRKIPGVTFEPDDILLEPQDYEEAGIGLDARQAVAMPSDQKRRRLVEVGPPDEWSGGVAGALGPELRKELNETWDALPSLEKRKIREEFEANFGRTAAGYPGRRYRVEGLTDALFPTGTRLYHGTNAEDEFDMPWGPAWFSEGRAVAEWFKDWKGGDHAVDGGAPRVLTFEVVRPLRLIQVTTTGEWHTLLERMGASDQYELAEELARQGYAGWTIPNNYPEGGDILICDPKRWLRQVPDEEPAEGMQALEAALGRFGQEEAPADPRWWRDRPGRYWISPTGEMISLPGTHAEEAPAVLRQRHPAEYAEIEGRGRRGSSIQEISCTDALFNLGYVRMSPDSLPTTLEFSVLSSRMNSRAKNLMILGMEQFPGSYTYISIDLMDRETWRTWSGTVDEFYDASPSDIMRGARGACYGYRDRPFERRIQPL